MGVRDDVDESKARRFDYKADDRLRCRLQVISNAEQGLCDDVM